MLWLILLIFSGFSGAIIMASFLMVTNKSSWFMVFWLVMMAVSTGCLFGILLSKWLMVIIILLYVGGMMVLFSYILSLSSYFKPVFNYEVVLYTLIFSMLFNMGNLFFFRGFQAIEIYSSLGFIGLSFISIYLLLILILSVKMVGLSSGPLKSFSD